jgi:hypothetical protein
MIEEPLVGGDQQEDGTEGLFLSGFALCVSAPLLVVVLCLRGEGTLARGGDCGLWKAPTREISISLVAHWPMLRA